MFIPRCTLFRHIPIVIFSFLSLCPVFFSSPEFHTLLYLYPPPRHTNNNYFLNAYQHIWLELNHENSDSGSLLSMLTVKFVLPPFDLACLIAPRSPPDMGYNTDLNPTHSYVLAVASLSLKVENVTLKRKCFERTLVFKSSISPHVTRLCVRSVL